METQTWIVTIDVDKSVLSIDNDADKLAISDAITNALLAMKGVSEIRVERLAAGVGTEDV